MRTPAQWAISFVVVSFFAACSSDPVDQPDAATDGDADADADFEVALPVLTPCPDGWEEVPPEEEGGVTTCDPWPGSSPVVMTPCPEGWREVEDDGVVTCDPWPEGGPHECAEDEAHFPGEPGCSRIGTECPDGNWAEDLPDDRPILYVLAGAPAGGEGTQESPFGSIHEALEVAEEGTVVALSKGTFDEAVRLRNGITLWGACVAETMITCSIPSSETGTVTVGGRDTVVRNLQVGGQRRGVLVAGARSYSIHVEELLIARSRIVGVLVANGRLTAHDLVVRETRSRESDDAFGGGLEVLEGAEVEIVRAVFESNRNVGVHAFHEGTTLSMTEVLVRDTQSQESDAMFGSGVVAGGGAHVELQRAVFEGNHDLGARVFDVGTILTLTDSVVRDTQGRESDHQSGHGLSVYDEAHVVVRRSVFERNRYFGLGAFDAGTQLELSDVVVRDTLSQESDDDGGIGLTVTEGADAEVSRSVFERNRTVGVLARHEGSTLGLTDVVVRNTLSRESDGEWGRGLQVRRGAQVAAQRALFEQHRDVGIVAASEGSTLSLTDVVVRDTQGRESDGFLGRGLAVGEGAQVVARRTAFERNRDVCVAVFHSGTTLRLEDVVVRDTESQDSDGRFGRGLSVQAGAHAEVSRAVFERNREVSIAAYGDASDLTIADVLVRETLGARCGETGDCPVFGDGVISDASAVLEITGLVVSRNARCGVTVHDATMDLHDGEVFDNTIGACINAEDFELDRLMDNVVYRDNERRLDPNFNMPVPEPAMPSEWEDE